jgi:hypothetical protein
MNTAGSLLGEKVVVRYLNGTLVKGYTFDFSPRAREFHVFPDRRATSDPRRVHVTDLKAVFSVKTFDGDPRYCERKAFALRPGVGHRVEVTFRDGEVLVGTVRSASTDNLGFFLTPADPASNNLRVFVVGTAVARVRPMPEPRSPRERDVTTPTQPRAPRGEGVELPRRLLTWLLPAASSASRG